MALQRHANFRMRGFGAAGTVPDADPSNPGGSILDDGQGNIVIVDANGVVTHFAPGLGHKVAWLQTPVYIALGLGIVLGAVGMKYIGKK